MADLINALFEGLAGFFILASIRDAWKSRQAIGIHPLHVAYFTAWGFWNLYYYAHLDQWLSWACGILVAIVNSFYLYTVIKFRRKC
jgi:hypothetical protein